MLLPGVRRENGSPSSRRAWIEIGTALQELQRRRVALLAEGVDRNISRASNPPSAVVALLAEGVDRNNNIRKILAMLDKVALLAEGVDRNNNKAIPDLMKMVALLAEGVDRNSMVFPFSFTGFSRPPRGGRG